MKNYLTPKYREYKRQYQLKRRVSILMLLGGNCDRCSNNDMRVLQIDHKLGVGNKECGEKLVTKALYNPNQYQVLCANCNWIKRFENKENRKRIDEVI